MNIKPIQLSLLACLAILNCAFTAPKKTPDLVSLVDTRQGTDSEWSLSYGNTYPTVAMPFPVHSFSAQTGKNGDGWKYQYKAETIRGFQQVHQCSPWVNDYATFSLMPVIGELVVNENERATAFNHQNETARPHYYRVELDNGVKAEISPVTRGGHMRFSFPKGEEAFLVLDGYTEQSSIKIDPESRKITGWVNNGLLVPDNFRAYFELQFDRPFLSYGTWENKENSVQKGAKNAEGDGKGAFVQFKPGTVVQVKIASSYISPAQAHLNMKQELEDHENLDQTKKEAKDTWNELMGRVLVEGGNEKDRATFYSCLFRANLFSHRFFEINEEGKPYYFSPYDGEIHEGYMYTDNGFWDTFRAQFPLSNILHPTMQARYMQSLLDAQKQSGFLPTWSCPGTSGIMIGNHAISLLADAHVKGVGGFDATEALEAYFHEITNKGPWGGSNGREAHKDWFELGYIPYKVVGESAAKTLEYSYDDFCGYQIAKSIGNEHYARIFGRQMYNYKNIYDPGTGFMRGKKRNGEWALGEDFSPIAWGDPFTEANAWQYSWSVFHDINGLVNLMGGEGPFTKKLDTFFSMPSVYDVGHYGEVIHEMREMELANMGQYAHGNQPVQHVAYLYNYIGQPWKTQQRVRKIMTELYHPTPKGFPGDEDQGGMSSWYVLSAMGFYSVCPGTDQYVIGSPLFEKVTLTLEDGKEFVVEARKNDADNVYIQSATLNGQLFTKNYITYSQIVNGGKLLFMMGSSPNKTRAVAKEDRPFSLSELEKSSSFTTETRQ
ncbi:GH92 family glycosyl hydrolase [Echinicola rosea]|uniref:Alpha-1 2-mannosidase n=1 Tax=Echinicola rosea TaxID=1807691 RepID=A0ABQ1UQY6_9BACT|nr:GH92 family glycosyl hydrolase [Echinicola rosea]GGF24400.1 alpha-1 2-mannosidase [Echinicola rosea]